jgi:serine carboxypeptidase-like clade II
MLEEQCLTGVSALICYSVLDYELLNLQIPTINVVGSLVKSGIRVLVYRYEEIKIQLLASFQLLFFGLYTMELKTKRFGPFNS